MKEKAKNIIVNKDNIEQIEHDIAMYKMVEKEKEYFLANKKKRKLLGKAFVWREKTNGQRSRCADIYCLPIRAKSRNNESMECLCFSSDISFREISTDKTDIFFSCLNYEFLTLETIPVSKSYKIFKMFGRVFEEITVEEYWDKALKTMCSLKEKTTKEVFDVGEK